MNSGIKYSMIQKVVLILSMASSSLFLLSNPPISSGRDSRVGVYAAMAAAVGVGASVLWAHHQVRKRPVSAYAWVDKRTTPVRQVCKLAVGMLCPKAQQEYAQALTAGGIVPQSPFSVRSTPETVAVVRSIASSPDYASQSKKDLTELLIAKLDPRDKHLIFNLAIQKWRDGCTVWTLVKHHGFLAEPTGDVFKRVCKLPHSDELVEELLNKQPKLVEAVDIETLRQCPISVLRLLVDFEPEHFRPMVLQNPELKARFEENTETKDELISLKAKLLQSTSETSNGRVKRLAQKALSKAKRKNPEGTAELLQEYERVWVECFHTLTPSDKKVLKLVRHIAITLEHLQIWNSVDVPGDLGILIDSFAGISYQQR